MYKCIHSVYVISINLLSSSLLITISALPQERLHLRKRKKLTRRRSYRNSKELEIENKVTPQVLHFLKLKVTSKLTPVINVRDFEYQFHNTGFKA